MGVLGHWAGRGMKKWCLEVAGARPGGLVATWLCGQTELHSGGGGSPGLPQVQGFMVGSLTTRGRTGDFREVMVTRVLDMLCWNVEAHVTSRWLEIQVQILGERSGPEMRA